MFQAGVDHVILAVSYRAEMLEREIKAKEEQVCIDWKLIYSKLTI